MYRRGKYVFFVYHYDEEGDDLIKLLALILARLNIPSVTGRDLNGRRISDEVQRRIEWAGLVVVVLTREPTNWIVQEITWAVAHHVPCLLVIQEGVNFDPGIAGDVEQIRFPPGGIIAVLKRTIIQIETLMSAGFDIQKSIPHTPTGDRAKLLIIESKEHMDRNEIAEAVPLAEEALRLDPGAAEAVLILGAAMMKKNKLGGAEAVFKRLLAEFPDAEDSLRSKADYNLAGIEYMRDAGSFDEASVRRQIGYLKKSLEFDHKNFYARASLILCLVALGQIDEAISLTEESIKFGRRFRIAFRRLVERRGADGHRLLGKLPGWVYSLLFPPRFGDEDDDGDGPQMEDSARPRMHQERRNR